MTTRDQPAVVTCPSCEGLIGSDGSCRCGPSAFPLLGSVLGNVRLDAVLGAGGMGRVYEGFDLSLHRRVAVKVLDRAAPAEVQERFSREGRALASLEHPNVVPVHAAGVSAEGSSFIVMKLLAAKTLSQWAAASVPARSLLPVLQQLADAVDALHACGIIHRDIKPANVMIDDAGKVTLVDLGVALGQGPRLTKVGLVVGTVDFMSPEQLAGEPLSPATDLYALGLLTSELLVGPRRLSIRAREQELAARFSGQAPRVDTLNPLIDPAVALVVQRALAVDPKDRFQSAGAFVRAFERAVQASSVKTLEQPALERPSRRPRALLIVSCAAVASLGVCAWSLGLGAQVAGPSVDSDVVAHRDAGAPGLKLTDDPSTEARVQLGQRLVQEIAAARVTHAFSLHLFELLDRHQSTLRSASAREDEAALRRRHNALVDRYEVARDELLAVVAQLEAGPAHEAAALIVSQAKALGGIRPANSAGETTLALALLFPRASAPVTRELERARDSFAARVDRGGLDTVLAVHLEYVTRGPVGPGLEALLARAPKTPDVEAWRELARLIRLELGADGPVGASSGVLGKFVDNNSIVDDVTIGEFRREVRDGESIERMLNRMNEAIHSDDDKKELFERALLRVNESCAAADTKRKLIDCDDEARKLHDRFFKL